MQTHIIKFRIQKMDPQHIEIRVFDGPDRDHLALCGVLITMPETWNLLRAAAYDCEVLIEEV